MKLLALDTATEALSVALWCDGDTRSRFEIIGRGHAEQLLPMAASLLAEAGIRFQDLDAIAFGRGPGAFTGVRIATAAAQGLGYGLSLPLVPISNLAAVGFQALQQVRTERLEASVKAVLVCLDARMGEVYYGLALPDAARGVVLREEALGNPGVVVERYQHETALAGAGHGFEAYSCALREGLRGSLQVVWPSLLPRAEDIARLAAPRLALGDVVSPDDACPVYLRDDVAMRSTRPQA
jgi:tRNA threonylcarbamoyladenosine biosynthesis protein TsaB